ncbi:MAG: hypothetical protein HRU19_11570 [Pseudobacteriovorax sp.]|nr:hypothetical protein [Pseudobacteriovorax sp.]
MKCKILLTVGSSLIVSLPAFASLDPYLQIRPRVEFVDDGVVDKTDNGEDDTENALAVTTKVALGVKIPKTLGLENLMTHIEFVHVGSFARDYNSTSAAGNNDGEYAVVIDPPLTRVTQAYLSYSINPRTTVTAGRKLLALDDHRFVGTVGWRQMPQSFGLVELKYQDGNGFIQFDYLYERLGIKDEFNRLYKKGSLLLHGLYKVVPAFNLSLFHYQIEDAHDTSGVKITGDAASLHYELTYAVQKDPSRTENEVEIDADFVEVDLGYKVGSGQIKANYYVLGKAKGETEKGFATPLATLHKFEGWSDTMLGFAAGGNPLGLQVASFGGNLKTSRGTFGAFYLKYDSVDDSQDYGSEIDVVFTNKIKPNLTLQVKGAAYSKGDASPSDDVTKAWLMLTAKI